MRPGRPRAAGRPSDLRRGEPALWRESVRLFLMIASDLHARPARIDETAERLVAFLRAEGAGDLTHARAGTLLDHLAGTYEIVSRWEQPAAIAHAALIHSVYGTDVYGRALLPLARRHELVSLAGEQAERLAYLFSVTPRGPLLAGTHAWLRDVPRRLAGEAGTAADPPAGEAGTAADPPGGHDESDALIVLHMANLADQAQARDGSPGAWLAKLRELAELVIASEAVTLPLFIAELATFTAADEAHTRELYRAGLAEDDDLERRRTRLALAAATCAVVPEPCVWLAHLSHCRRDVAGATWWARCAQRRLRALGTAWDKRLTFGEWGQLARLLERPGEEDASSTVELANDPGALFAARCQRPAGTVPSSPVAVSIGRVSAPTEAVGRERFHRYVDTFANAAGTARGAYPDLESRPWHDASGFPLAAYLESHFAEIRDEVLALCPVTTRGIETLPAMRTAAGLIYVSRMRSGAHIRPHRGPTNLRLRCHLGISVPDGDCALRVGDDTRQWQEGRCLVFDDYLEHEAWNHTAQDRIVLIVDLWHPGLSATEVRLLEWLHGYSYGYARRLHRYWAANAAAADRPASA